jgi:hypothetical protein
MSASLRQRAEFSGPGPGPIGLSRQPPGAQEPGGYWPPLYQERIPGLCVVASRMLWLRSARRDMPGPPRWPAGRGASLGKAYIMIVTIELQDLGCVDQFRSEGCRPYLWGVLLQVDDETIRSGALVATVSFAPPPDGAFVPIASAMHAGDSAAIPGAVSRYGARFRSGQNTNDLILVVILWDARDTPAAAVVAGYEAFLGEIRDAVADNLQDLSTANEDQLNVIEAKISQRVHDKVGSAIQGQLSDLEKVEVELGILTPDQLINSAFRHVSIQDAASAESFTLPFSDNLNDDFDLHAQMTVTADPCEDQLARVGSAQRAIENTQGALKQLQGEPESKKTEQAIEELENELLVLQARLTQAQHDLNQCRIANP